MGKNKTARNARIKARQEPKRVEAKALALTADKPFMNWAGIVIKEIQRLQLNAKIYGMNSIPNIESLRKFFDEDKHPIETAKHYFDSWH